MSKKKYVLEELRAIQNKVRDSKDEYTSHFVIAVDQDENGYPESTMTMASSKPAELLGMCTHLIAILKQIKKDTLKKLLPNNNNIDLSNAEEFDKMTSNLPKPIADKIRDFKKRMDAAVESGDADDMRKIKDELLEMKNPFRQMNKDLDELTGEKNDEFDINDFK